MNQTTPIEETISAAWAQTITPALVEYVAIPALSPSFDPQWADNGHIGRAVDLIRGWIESQKVAGMSVHLHELDGRTPVLLVTVDAFGPNPSDETVLLYGHLDKQPEMTGWRPDLGPWKPVIEGTRLYGRGGADDGYAAFASLTAIAAVQAAGGSHSRCVMLIEASEESGSPDLEHHVNALREELGEVGLVICLDSGCANFDTLWLTTSLRGMVAATVRIDVLVEGVHSGMASGVVPSSFRLLRRVLDQLEDSESGRVLVDAAWAEIPENRIAEAKSVADQFGSSVVGPFPEIEGLELMQQDVAEALLATTWRPALSVTGVDGMPGVDKAGNVLRPHTSLKLSLRLAPTADPERARSELVDRIRRAPTEGAQISILDTESAPGWNSPPLADWLHSALNEASDLAFGAGVQLFGEGGSIPFMGMLGELFPDSQFVITGVLGPETNAHGPNEFLELAYAEKLTLAIAYTLGAHARH